MFTLAHLSDPHLAPLPPARLMELASKRITGYLNYQRNRARHLETNTLEHLVADLKAQTPDHIAVTGDLINIGLDLEIERAADWLADLGKPDQISLVCGNHDSYVPGVLKKAHASWQPYLTGDSEATSLSMVSKGHDGVTFPYVRKRGPLAIIGLSSAGATPPFFATGTLGRTQLNRLGALLDDLEPTDLFRVVLIHHPPHPRSTSWYKRLTDGASLRRLLREKQVDLILHGHTHKHTRHAINGPNGPIPVIGVASASSGLSGHRDPASYNLFHLRPNGDRWHCDWEKRCLTAGGFKSEGRVSLS
ncbi:MAG: metallophosphoesterase [Pseudomonadota bacterium]